MWLVRHFLLTLFNFVEHELTGNCEQGSGIVDKLLLRIQRRYKSPEIADKLLLRIQRKRKSPEIAAVDSFVIPKKRTRLQSLTDSVADQQNDRNEARKIKRESSKSTSVLQVKEKYSPEEQRKNEESKISRIKKRLPEMQATSAGTFTIKNVRVEKLFDNVNGFVVVPISEDL